MHRSFLAELLQPSNQCLAMLKPFHEFLVFVCQKAASRCIAAILLYLTNLTVRIFPMSQSNETDPEHMPVQDHAAQLHMIGCRKQARLLQVGLWFALVRLLSN